MGSRPNPSRKKDEDKSRVELLTEIKSLRDKNARLEEDIRLTGQERTEDKLREPFQLISDILGNFTYALFAVNANWRITYANRRAEEYWHRRREGLPGIVLWDLFTDYEMAQCYSEYMRAARERIPVCFRMLSPDLHTWVEVNVYPTMDGGLAISFRDVTERQQMAETIMESDSRFNAIFNSVNRAGMGIAIADITGRIRDCNTAFQRMLGYRKDELLLKTFMDITYPEDVGRNLDLFKRAVNGQFDNYQIEKRYIRKDGRPIWCRLTASFIKDEQGELKYNLAIVEDITERKALEDALQESEEKFRALAGSSKTGIILVQGEDTIYINQALADMGGYTIGECMRMRYWDVAPAEIKEYLRERGAARQHGWHGPSRTELKLIKKNGDEIWLDCTWAVLTYRGKPAVLVMALDITERKQAEWDLRLARFSIERAGDMVFWVAPDGSFIYVNESACRTLGYTRDELLSMTVCNAMLIYNEDNWQKRWDELKRQSSLTIETSVKAKDGRMIPVEITDNFIEYGGWEYSCAYARDITERKRAEEDLKVAKAQAELYLDLMGHDINNMHQVAMGYLEFAGDMQAEGVQRDYLDKAIEVLRRSAKLIQNVRKLQKLQEGEFQAQEVDVCTALVDVQREFGAVPYKTVTLNPNGNEHCYVKANELLHDVFANLVGNAVKHTGDYAEIVMDLDVVEENGRYCRVMVEDNGPGIPDDFKAKIFNRALKGTAKAKGMGLGLYLVKSLVDSYGGRVWAEDRIPGDHTKGARFVVVLPAIQ